MQMDSQLVELLRKLCLTGLVVFVEPGTVTQAFFALISALFFLLMVMRYLPYEEDALDRLAFFAQLCTTATL